MEHGHGGRRSFAHIRNRVRHHRQRARAGDAYLHQSVISLLAFLAYIPLVFIVPKSKPEQEPLKLGCMEYYDKMEEIGQVEEG